MSFGQSGLMGKNTFSEENKHEKRYRAEKKSINDLGLVESSPNPPRDSKVYMAQSN